MLTGYKEFFYHTWGCHKSPDWIILILILGPFIIYILFIVIITIIYYYYYCMLLTIASSPDRTLCKRPLDHLWVSNFAVSVGCTPHIVRLRTLGIFSRCRYRCENSDITNFSNLGQVSNFLNRNIFSFKFLSFLSSRQKF